MKKDRRDFVKLAGTAMAGAVLLPACMTGTQTGATSEQIVKPIGLQLYTLRNQLRDDLDGTLNKVAETGYKYVELFGYGDRQYFGMPAADMYAKIKSRGMEIRSSHHLSGLFAVTGQGTLSNGWEQAVEDAASAGQKYMVCAYLFPQERETLDGYKKLAEMLNKAGEACKSAGLTFCYHNHDFEFQELEGQLPMYVMLDETDPELVQVELDLYWITKAGLDPIAFFEKYPQRTPLWHVKDMDNTSEGKFAEVGTGVIDFKRIFANADKSGMKSFFVEQDESADPLQSIKTSFDFVSSTLMV